MVIADVSINVVEFSGLEDAADESQKDIFLKLAQVAGLDHPLQPGDPCFGKLGRT